MACLAKMRKARNTVRKLGRYQFRSDNTNTSKARDTFRSVLIAKYQKFKPVLYMMRK